MPHYLFLARTDAAGCKALRLIDLCNDRIARSVASDMICELMKADPDGFRRWMLEIVQDESHGRQHSIRRESLPREDQLGRLGAWQELLTLIYSASAFVLAASALPRSFDVRATRAALRRSGRPSAR